MIDYRLYLVTDDPSRYRGDWLDNVVAAVEGGVTCVQYRDTESAPAERLARVRRLQDALAGRVPLVINNEAELAAAVKAEGVHVGQSDLAPEKVRAIVGPACEIGLSITDISQVAQLRDNPFVDAIGVGPVYDARQTKADAAAALGPAGLSAIATALPVSWPGRLSLSWSGRPRPGKAEGISLSWSGRPRPDKAEGISLSWSGRPRPDKWNANPSVSQGGDALATANHAPRATPLVAIGGITLANARAVLDAGADGLAVVSAFSKSPDPFATARSFCALFP